MGYSTLAFNLTLPPGTPFASQAVRQCNPCYEHRPPFPALSHQQPGGLLQLSRLTLTLDEATVKSGGGGLVRPFFPPSFKIASKSLTLWIRQIQMRRCLQPMTCSVSFLSTPMPSHMPANLSSRLPPSQWTSSL